MRKTFVVIKLARYRDIHMSKGREFITASFLSKWSKKREVRGVCSGSGLSKL